MNGTLAMVLAGGKGARLGPLTCHRAKPATPFGGRYRIIDFVLANFVNSGYRKVYVLTQYKASSLIRHLAQNWHLSGPGEFVEVAPAQMRTGEHWYRGTADSVFQNLNLIRDVQPEQVAVFGGDHVYSCAVDQVDGHHRRVGADLTVAAFPVPRDEARDFGVIEVDADGRITGFQEKPSNPRTIPGRPDTCLVSMGNYIFRASVLTEALREDNGDPKSRHDFGKDVIPRLLRQGRKLHIYDFSKNRIPGQNRETAPYWRDVGTLDGYFQANMELRGPQPSLDLSNRRWRVRTAQRDYPPVRFIGAGVKLDDSLVAEGTVVESAQVRRSLIGYDCRLRRGAQVQDSLLMSGCSVGAGAIVRNVIADKDVRIAPGARIGLDPDEDRERFPCVTPAGRVVLPKGSFVPEQGPIEIPWDIAELL